MGYTPPPQQRGFALKALPTPEVSEICSLTMKLKLAKARYCQYLAFFVLLQQANKPADNDHLFYRENYAQRGTQRYLTRREAGEPGMLA